MGKHKGAGTVQVNYGRAYGKAFDDSPNGYSMGPAEDSEMIGHYDTPGGKSQHVTRTTNTILATRGARVAAIVDAVGPRPSTVVYYRDAFNHSLRFAEIIGIED